MTTKNNRSQQDRSIRTKEKLLDATLELINKVGWTGTTLSLICETSGVSRGAQAHHYRTKAELYSAAAHRSIAMLRQEIKGAIDKIPLPEDRLDTMVKILWDAVFYSKLLTSWFELVIAARTNEDLRRDLQPVDAELVQMFRQIVFDLAKEVGDPDPMETTDILNLLSNAMRGMALQKILSPETFDEKKNYELTVKIFQKMREK